MNTKTLFITITLQDLIDNDFTEMKINAKITALEEVARANGAEVTTTIQLLEVEDEPQS